MKQARAMMMGAALFLVPAMASAQGWGWQDRDRDGRDDRMERAEREQQFRSRAYEDGWYQGRSDYRNNRRTKMDKRRWNGRERGEWQSGYNAGYHDAMNARNNGRWGRGRDNGGWGNGGYGNGGYYGLSGQGADRAREKGFSDGQRDGARDRSTGHSFRYPEQDRYRDGDSGYTSSFGDKDSYRQIYRSAYERGYRQGYGRR